MNEHQSTLRPGQIQFHQWCEPPLEPGDYVVRVDQTVAELAAEPTSGGKYRHEFHFSVAGPRFTLDPSEIYSVYPPKGEIGDFADTLPHVVFTRRTLPWERSLIPGHRADDDRRPWMALLVFNAQDFATEDAPDGAFPEIKLRKVAELINPTASDDFVGPQLNRDIQGVELDRGGLADYESPSDLCATIDLPWTLFQGVVPSANDVEYLAHVREVNTDHKETASFLADGWFSVVLANRLPLPERAGTEPPLAVENRAYLVSLEGMEQYLPDDDALAGNSAEGKPMRLAVLSSWSFHCHKAFNFKSSMNKLDVRRLAVPWSNETAANAGASDAATLVRRAYSRGYTALNHSTRLGEKTVSWYRGPLVPLYHTKQTKYKFRPAADAALRYDPTTGMMEVTYAVAFQLGRLLALQDRRFATALYAYRNDVRRKINQVLGRKQAQSALGFDVDGNGDSNSGSGENELMGLYLRTRAGRADNTPPKNGWNGKTYTIPPPPKDDKEADVADKPNQLRLTSDFDLTIPDVITKWLAKLLLLYRVPFVNLAPDERMLPPDSIRFFHLDPGWLKCLLEGACSVGRSSSHDELVDEYLRDNFLKLAIDESQNVRTRTPEMDANSAGTQPVTEIPATGPEWRKLTGFLMRSPVVAGWQGLEMRAWSDSGATKALTPLRIDRLAPDIMICIFDDQVNRIEVKQPPEGMHFGATPDGENYKRFHLRRLDRSGPGDQLGKSTETLVPMRNQNVKRVVAVAQLATDMSAKLAGMRESGAFTSADFGVEMVESPGRVIFDVMTHQEADA